MDYKKGKFILGSIEDESPLQLYDFRTFKQIPGLDWYQKGRVKREGVKIYGTSFFHGRNDFSLIACGSNRNELRIFTPIDDGNLRNNSLEFNYLHSYSIKNRRKGIYCCSISPTNDRVIFGTGDGYLHSLSLTY